MPEFSFDPEQITKVVTNLVLNAREAMTGPGEIHLETRAGNGWAVLSVRDTGAGIPQAEREHVLRRFVRLEASRNEPGSGEINYPFIFGALDEAGYDGWVGCEYKPATTTTAGLGWFAPYRKSAA